MSNFQAPTLTCAGYRFSMNLGIESVNFYFMQWINGYVHDLSQLV